MLQKNETEIGKVNNGKNECKDTFLAGVCFESYIR